MGTKFYTLEPNKIYKYKVCLEDPLNCVDIFYRGQWVCVYRNFFNQHVVPRVIKNAKEKGLSA